MKNLKYFLFLLIVSYNLYSQELVATLTVSPTSLGTYNGGNNNIKFGEAVDITDDENFMIIGAPLFDKDPDTSRLTDEGLIQIFKKNNNQWELIKSETASPTNQMNFGRRVSVSRYNNLVFFAASAPNTSNPQGGLNGFVKIYAYDIDQSAFVTTGFDLNEDGDILDAGEGEIISESQNFGHSISFSGDGTVLAISEPGYDPPGSGNNGRVLVYKYQNDVNKTWRLISGDSSIAGNGIDHYLGASVDVNNDGTIILATSSNKGYFEVYKYIIQGVYNIVGTSITTHDDDDNIDYGIDSAISSDGNRVFIGVPKSNNNKGYVKIYNYDANEASLWSNPTILNGPNLNVGEGIRGYFGHRLDLNNDGDKIVITGSGTNTLVRDVYETSDGTNWTAKNYNFPISLNWDYLPESVKFTDNSVIFGLYQYDTDFIGGVEIFSIVTSPTLTITSNTEKINNSSNPIITFTSSKDTGDFNSGDISVTTGSISSFTATSSKVYTVNYTPPLNSSGTVTFSVADNAFTDSSGSGNISSTLNIPFDTISPTLSLFTDDHIDLLLEMPTRLRLLQPLAKLCLILLQFQSLGWLPM